MEHVVTVAAVLLVPACSMEQGFCEVIGRRLKTKRAKNWTPKRQGYTWRACDKVLRTRRKSNRHLADGDTRKRLPQWRSCRHRSDGITNKPLRFGYIEPEYFDSVPTAPRLEGLSSKDSRARMTGE